MKKICLFFAIFSLFAFVSCGGDSKNENKNDEPDTGEAVTDDDKADTESDTADTDTDTADTDTATEPADDTDTTSEQPDEGDSQPDDTDTASDDDADSQPDDSDTVPEPTESEKCIAAGGTWTENSEAKSCTKTTGCNEKPENAEWNGPNSYTQTYADGVWSAEKDTEYSPTAGDCKFKCKEGYFWDKTKCKEITLANICTGQTKCYDAEKELESCPESPSGTGEGYNFYGQDAQFTDRCIAQNFSVKTPVEEQNVVFDHNTGLTWEQSPSSIVTSWGMRARHCNQLTGNFGTDGFAQIKDWRVPNQLELVTIVDISRYSPATNPNFTGMPNTNTALWTNGARQFGNATQPFSFDAAGGWYSYEERENISCPVICVSGDELATAASDDFVTSSDSLTVTDNKTGLMWQKEYVSGKLWQQALAYCQSLNEEGYGGYSTGWRLPNKNELASLLDPSKSDKPFSNFPDMPDENFCSSSTNAEKPVFAWSVSFKSGGVLRSQFKTNECFVRCVR